MTCLRSMLVVASLSSTASAQVAPSVAVDLSRLDSEAAADAAELEQALVMRLLQEGFAIDPLTAEPAIVVAVAGSDREIVLSAKSAHFERSRTIDAAGASGAQLQLEVVQKVVELARLAREAVPPPSSPADTSTATLQHAVVDVERPPRWRLGADFGVVSSTTLEISLHARYTISDGLGMAVRAGMAQPDARDISVDEQEILAGGGYEWSLGHALAFDVGLLGGIRRHQFELAMPLAEPTGTRFDAVLAVPVRISLRPSHAFEMSLWGIVKLSREREHVNGTAVLWHREPLGVGAGAGVAARF